MKFPHRMFDFHGDRPCSAAPRFVTQAERGWLSAGQWLRAGAAVNFASSGGPGSKHYLLAKPLRHGRGGRGN